MAPSIDDTSATKHPLCVLLVWLGTLAFVCCVAAEAKGAQVGDELAAGASEGRLGFALAAGACWMIAGCFSARRA